MEWWQLLRRRAILVTTRQAGLASGWIAQRVTVVLYGLAW